MLVILLSSDPILLNLFRFRRSPGIPSGSRGQAHLPKAAGISHVGPSPSIGRGMPILPSSQGTVQSHCHWSSLHWLCAGSSRVRCRCQGQTAKTSADEMSLPVE